MNTKILLALATAGVITTATALVAAPATSDAEAAAPVEQASTGTVKGRVLDKEGEPAKGVAINLVSEMNFDGGDVMQQQKRTIKTDQNGNFNQSGMPAKMWKYTIGTPGGADGYASGIFQVKAGETIEQEIRLR